MILQSQISKLSNRLFKEQGGRRIPEVALLDRARTEPRDLYDLWYLTAESRSVDLADCLPAISEKLLYRGKKLGDVREEFHKKELRLKKMWENRLSGQMANLTEFDHVYRVVKRSLRQAGITD